MGGTADTCTREADEARSPRGRRLEAKAAEGEEEEEEEEGAGACNRALASVLGRLLISFLASYTD